MKKVVEAKEMELIRCTSTVSMYHESFSWRIAFVARAFLGAQAFPKLAFSIEVGGVTSDRSLTTSKVLGFSRWKFSSK